MRVAFAGTPEFAEVALARLHAEGFTPALVLTQPDRPAGRGLKLQASPVKAYAGAHGIEVVQPRGLRLDGRYADDARSAQQALRRVEPEVIVVAAYGLLLPPWVLALPTHGCINIHASLLPRWRGAAPIHRAIEAGDAETGITIMQMDAGLDTGAMLLAERVAIELDDTTGGLQPRLAALGGSLVVGVLRALGRGSAPMPQAQPDAGATYARKLDKAEADIDWHLPAALIERRLRAFDPFPGASTSLLGETVKCWRARVGAGVGAPGEILAASDDAIRVGCGVGTLDLTQLQRPGGRRVSAREFMQRRPVTPGTRFGPAAV